MALLLEVRPLNSPELHRPAMTLGRFSVRRASSGVEPNHPLSVTSPSSQEHPNAFRNPTFESDLSPEGANICNGRANGAAVLKPDLTSRSDSGINICVISDEVQSVNSKSFDSGGFDEGVKVDLNPTGGSTHSPGNDLPPKPCDPEKTIHKDETLASICIQVFIPFLIAGVGTCGAGILLDMVEGWEVFRNVTEIFVLVPTLLGLKGNLEMTLASRVSTQANLGKLSNWKKQWKMSWGNMALIQCQATVLGFLSACFATLMTFVNGKFNLQHALLLCASALSTASIASFLLGAATLAVVIISHKLSVNPDNVATPIAASLGDITTLGILAVIGKFLFIMGDNYLPSIVIISVFLALVPLWAILAYRNEFVRQVLFTGWTPVIVAVVITSAGGYVLEFSVTKFSGFAIFQPVINGVAGNLVAVQASRISTYFHWTSDPGSRPPDGANLCISPIEAFFGKSSHARTARVLLLMVIPGHVLFGYSITLIKGGDTVLTPTFLPIYLSATFIQVALLLYIAHCMIQIMWRFKIDPDNSAIPLLTALGDLSGMVFLTLAFTIYYSI